MAGRTFIKNTRGLFRLQYGYGEKPILSQVEYINAIESDQSENLKYKQIRFPKLDETNSPLYDAEYERFITNAMRDGRKDLFRKIFDDTFYLIKSIQLRKINKQKNEDLKGEENKVEIETNPLVIFKKAIDNCRPAIICQKVKRGGSTYQVPFPLDYKTSYWYSMKWMISAVKDRPRPKRRKYREHMAEELLSAFKNEGKVIKRRDDMHKLGEANKAYSHYRWG